jgi:tetratricopeptide (TPR) repeat protein
MTLHHACIIAIGLSFLASPALADACGDAEMNLLESKGTQDAVMSACTVVIQSGAAVTADSADDYQFRGEIYQSRNDDTDAFADYDQAVKLDPMHQSDLIYKKARSLEMSGALDRAIAYYSEAIRLQPDYADAYSGRANAYADKGDHTSAIGDLDQAVRYHPTDYIAYAGRGYERAAANTQLDLAAVDCSKSLSLTDSIDGRHCAGLVALRAGRFDQAIAAYDAVIALAKRDNDPVDGETLIGLGIAELRKGDKSGKVKISKAEKVWPGVTVRFAKMGLAP